MPKVQFDRSLIWKSLLPIGVSALLLTWAIRRVEADRLLEALSNIQWHWFWLAILGFGIQGIFAGWRWHMMAHVTQASTHLGASLRLFFISPALNFFLLGPALGDLVKSAIAARWFGVNLPRLIAAAPLDRIVGLIGLALFCIVAMVIAGVMGVIDLDQAAQARSKIRPEWLILAALSGIAGLLVVLRWRPQSKHPVFQFYNAFADGFRQIAKTPSLAFPAISLGFVVQTFSAVIFFFCLRAVAVGLQLPWLSMLWVFPVIAASQAVPSFGGLGIREATSLVLLGSLYGVPEATAAAMALLAGLGVGLFWVLIGALLLGRESLIHHRLARHALKPQPDADGISAIMPVLNEEAHIDEAVKRLRAIPEVQEIIVVDGGSQDATVRRSEALGCRVIRWNQPSRGAQLRAGAEHAVGAILLFVHADTRVPTDAGAALLRALRDRSIVGGGFWKRFQERHPLMLGSRLRCAIRLFVGRRVLADQCLFVRREALAAIGGVPAIPIMEDIELCKRLRSQGRLALADATVTTSARKFLTNGVLKTYALLWKMSLLHSLGTSPDRLYQHYYGRAIASQENP